MSEIKEAIELLNSIRRSKIQQSNNLDKVIVLLKAESKPNRLTNDIRKNADNIYISNNKIRHYLRDTADIIDRLNAENKRLKIDKYRLVVPLYMQGMLEKGDIPKEHLEIWFEHALEKRDSE